ncbi:recombinase family protein [Paenibacillus chitinolyticus]|uniref:recombinase family protein n=1 Tax=Paenibacillus chitinolyticus TaxID=79263 RepID=UPI0036540306
MLREGCKKGFRKFFPIVQRACKHSIRSKSKEVQRTTRTTVKQSYRSPPAQVNRLVVNLGRLVPKEVPKEKQIITEDAHHANISMEDFEAVQQYMQGRKWQQAKPKANLFTKICKGFE